MKNNLKIFIIFVNFLILVQFSTIKLYPGWFKHYGGTDYDYSQLIQQTSEGGYIVSGYTKSFTYGDWDFSVYKLNCSGNKTWFKHYGGTDTDYGQKIQQTSDGGYIMAGHSESFTYGSYDIAVYKLNSSGNKTWFKHYGGSSDDRCHSIQQTSDGGYILTGSTDSYTYGGPDIAIYKLNSSGNKVWFKHYGGTDFEIGSQIQQTSDGGYIVVGYTHSYSYGASDFAIYKLNSSGNKVWFKHYGGSGNDDGQSIQQTSDGGYIVAGHGNSFTYGGHDFAIYKLNSSGNKTWFKHFGGTADDRAYSIKQTSDGGYIVTGRTVSYSYGSDDFAIYKLNSSGNKTWFKHYGGVNTDFAYSIQQTSEGGYIVSGISESYSHGLWDVAIYKLDSNGDK